MTAALAEGDPAPDFDLPDADGARVRLADLRGRPVVLYFYPKDDTTGCTRQAQEFTAAIADFQAAGAEVIGVSKDSTASHGKFRQKYGLAVRLASAAEDDMVERYGAWVQKSMYGRTYMGIDRSTFLIGRDGAIRRIWRKVKVPGHVAEVLEAVRALGGV